MWGKNYYVTEYSHIVFLRGNKNFVIRSFSTILFNLLSLSSNASFVENEQFHLWLFAKSFPFWSTTMATIIACVSLSSSLSLIIYLSVASSSSSLKPWGGSLLGVPDHHLVKNRTCFVSITHVCHTLCGKNHTCVEFTTQQDVLEVVG